MGNVCQYLTMRWFLFDPFIQKSEPEYQKQQIYYLLYYYLKCLESTIKLPVWVTM